MEFLDIGDVVFCLCCFLYFCVLPLLCFCTFVCLGLVFFAFPRVRLVTFLECTYCLPALYHVPCNACIHICSYIYCFPTHTDVGQSLLLMCMRRIVNMLLACVRALVTRLLACVRVCNGGYDSDVCACV